jgi:histidine ammonia-lyase
MLADLYNNGICPDIRQLGSLGASGDLAPLAHMSLTLLGEGMVRQGGREKTAAAALQSAGLSPMSLHAKEGLALLNGTQFSTGYAVWCQLHGEQLIGLANLTASLSLDVFNGKRAAYSEPVTRVRPHRGAMRTARTIGEVLAGSSLPERESEEVQDPYSFRCVPQVHGATWDALDHTRGVIETEINAVTDNPLVVPRDGVIISAGNFHAQPIALSLDYMAIALAELGNIAERRVFQLIDGQRGLPVYLTRHAGLHSGFMIPQYTAASMVSQNKQLCTPASVDSIVSSRGQEDHVSMAANAGTKAYRVVENVYRILAIEWMTAAMAMEFRRPHKTSPVLEDLLERYRKVVPALDHDRILSEDMERTVDFMKAIDVSELMEHD